MTSIEWCDVTWNPIRGCSRVSAGCGDGTGGGCYAERVAHRFGGPGQPYEGLTRLTAKGPRWTGVVRMVPEHLADPLRWRKPALVFVNSMSDLFHESLTNEEIAAVFGVMAAARQHTFQCLTKRAKRMREWFAWAASTDHRVACPGDRLLMAVNGVWAQGWPDGVTVPERLWSLPIRRRVAETAWPLPNVWLGVSVENQAAADERITDLLATPAALRFLSCEPLLGPVDLSAWTTTHAINEHGDCAQWCSACRSRQDANIDWCIAGCESGPGARPAQVGWYRSLRDQCSAAGVPFFLKQATASEPVTAERLGRSALEEGDRSHLKPGGVIGLPYLDGVQHAAFPVTT